MWEELTSLMALSFPDRSDGRICQFADGAVEGNRINCNIMMKTF